jgi:hypothetical protein
MKNSIRSLALLLGVFVLAQSTNRAFAVDVGDASEVNIKIFKMWVSPNTDCTDARLVYNNASATYQNMVDNPTFGTGSIPNGTYPCVVLKMSDLINGKPNYNSTSGHCLTNTTVNLDVFRADNDSSSTCPDGTQISGRTDAEDDPCLYMSTSGSDSNVGWLPTSPFPLVGALRVSGDFVGTFVSDFRGKIEDAGGECGIQPPVFGFR